MDRLIRQPTLRNRCFDRVMKPTLRVRSIPWYLSLISVWWESMELRFLYSLFLSLPSTRKCRKPASLWIEAELQTLEELNMTRMKEGITDRTDTRRGKKKGIKRIFEEIANDSQSDNTKHDGDINWSNQDLSDRRGNKSKTIGISLNVCFKKYTNNLYRFSNVWCFVGMLLAVRMLALTTMYVVNVWKARFGNSAK